MGARKPAASGAQPEAESGVQLVDAVTGLAVSPVVADESDLETFRSIAPHETEVRQIEAS